MKFLFFIFFLATLSVGVTLFLSNGLWEAVTLVVPSLMMLFAFAGLRGSLYGNTGQKLAGVVLSVLFGAVSYYWLGRSEFVISIFDYAISAPLWLFLGGLAGFLSATKNDAGYE